MLSMQSSITLNFFKLLMFSFVLLCLSIVRVFSQNPITNYQVLDSYLNGANKFLNNHSPVFDGITLVLPKTPGQLPHIQLPHVQLPHVKLPHHHPRAHHPNGHPHRHHTHQSHHMHHRPQTIPNLNPIPLSESALSLPFNPLLPLLSQEERPDYLPVYRSVIRPKFFNKYKKSKKNRYQPKYPKYRPKKYYYSEPKNSPKYYPTSINDRLREKDNEVDQQEEEEEDHRHIHQNDDSVNHEEEEEEVDPLEDPHNEEYEKPKMKSYFDDFPPYRKPQPLKPVFEVKSPISMNRTNFGRTSTPRPFIYSKNYDYSESDFQSEPKYTERKRRPVVQNDSQQNSVNSNHKKSQLLYERSPPYSTQNQFNFMKPKIESNKAKQLSSDSPNMLSSDSDEERPLPKRQRTATANQLYVKEKEKNFNKIPAEEEKSPPIQSAKGIPKEDLDSNDDPHFYPHQYAIEIRWNNKNDVQYDVGAPKGDVGDREMHSSKELDHARHRKYKHEEEEHWHEKKWLNEGLRKAYLNGQSLPMRIVKPTLKLPDGDFSPMPVYTQPLPNGATLDEINEHFAIPTPNFRVNNRFMEWAKNAIDLNPLQNSYITLYG